MLYINLLKYCIKSCWGMDRLFKNFLGILLHDKIDNDDIDDRVIQLRAKQMANLLNKHYENEVTLR